MFMGEIIAVVQGMPPGKSQHAHALCRQVLLGRADCIPVERHKGAVGSKHVRAAVQKALRGTHLIDGALSLTGMQRGAEHVLGLKWNHTEPG